MKISSFSFCCLLIWIFSSVFLYSANGQYLKSPNEVGEMITDELLSRPEFMMYRSEHVQAVHYAEVCAAYGAVRLATLQGDQITLAQLVKRYDRVVEEDIPNTANHVDANVYGILPLEIFLYNKKPGYLKQGLRFADEQWDNPLPDGLSPQTRYWIDDVYMISCLQVQAFRATGNMVYLERAAMEADAYVRKLQQPNGLFHHGESAPFYWGRGNGWVAAGLAELLSVLPETNPYYLSIFEGYRKMMKSLLEFQGSDGMWHQLIDYPESFAETSSTAMFGFAFVMGVKNRLLPAAPYREAYLKAWNALVGYIGADGKLGEVCVGTGQSKEVSYYLDRPRVAGDFHGQAPMLWFAMSLLEEAGGF